jgi:hypothetical protein
MASSTSLPTRLGWGPLEQVLINIQFNDRMKKKQILIIVILGLSFIPVPPIHAKQWDNGRLQLSSNRRYLMHENNMPFFWFGDTGWCIFNRLNTTEAEQYFSDRQARGFNIVQATVLGTGKINVSNPNHNIVNGEVPFHNMDPTRPNEEFFEHVDAIIEKAAQHDIYVGLLPIWGEYVCDELHGGLGDGPKIFTAENARIYGQWIANRYKDRPNIIWINGGDRTGNCYGSESLGIFRALGEGIKSVDLNHIITYHPSHIGASSYDWFHNDSWLDFNMIESNDKPELIYSEIRDGYNLLPIKPIVNGEPYYYGYDLAGRVYRSQSYWTILSGGAGHTFGRKYLWYFDKSTDGNDNSTLNSGDSANNWFDFLDTPETHWETYWNDFFQSIEWWKLIPSENIILSGENTGENRKVAARSSDGNQIVVYYSTRSSATINMSCISESKATARWWNPKDKSESIIGTIDTGSPQSFIPPYGWEDAVLHIFSQLAFKPAPISHKTPTVRFQQER